MQLEDVLRDPPRVHGGSGGPLVLFKMSDAALRFVDRHVDKGMTTLETGAGISTILFGLKQTRHICVVPDRDQVDRIREYCRSHGVPLDSVDFAIGPSELVLPRLDLPRLDVVLIDGRHGFPTPFIDWYYTANALRPGGLVVIDDTQLWTGDVLKRFLAGECEWRLEQDFFPRTVVFRKIAEGGLTKSWTEQPFLVRQTDAFRRADWIRRKVLVACRVAGIWT